MKAKPYLFIVMIFVLALTASCGGGAATSAPPAEVPVEEPAAEPPAMEEAPAEVNVDFPLPDDVKPGDVTDVGNGAINFQTSLSLPDAVTFYRFALIDLGYAEREILTVVEETTFSMVFDGHESGKAIVVQGVDLGDSVNINIRLEDI